MSGTKVIVFIAVGLIIATEEGVRDPITILIMMLISLGIVTFFERLNV